MLRKSETLRARPVNDGGAERARMGDRRRCRLRWALEACKKVVSSGRCVSMVPMQFGPSKRTRLVCATSTTLLFERRAFRDLLREIPLRQ